MDADPGPPVAPPAKEQPANRQICTELLQQLHSQQSASARLFFCPDRTLGVNSTPRKRPPGLQPRNEPQEGLIDARTGTEHVWQMWKMKVHETGAFVT